jgi:hypothetical protein
VDEATNVTDAYNEGDNRVTGKISKVTVEVKSDACRDNPRAPVLRQLCSDRGGSELSATSRLYRALLGLVAPWTVAGVGVDMKGQRVMVRVEAEPGPYPRPESAALTGRYDSKPRRRRHKQGLARGRPEVVGRIGVPEKANAKRHRYLTIVADLEQSRVLYR